MNNLKSKVLAPVFALSTIIGTGTAANAQDNVEVSTDNDNVAMTTDKSESNDRAEYNYNADNTTTDPKEPPTEDLAVISEGDAGDASYIARHNDILVVYIHGGKASKYDADVFARAVKSYFADSTRVDYPVDIAVFYKTDAGDYGTGFTVYDGFTKYEMMGWDEIKANMNDIAKAHADRDPLPRASVAPEGP